LDSRSELGCGFKHQIVGRLENGESADPVVDVLQELARHKLSVTSEETMERLCMVWFKRIVNVLSILSTSGVLV
jgi:hypothetical protein